MSRKYRVAHLVSHPIQYQAPLFRFLANQPKIDLTVFYLSDYSLRRFSDPGFGISLKWDISLLDGYDHVFLPVFGKRDRISFWRPLVRNLRRFLALRPLDALWIHGYAHHANLLGMYLAHRMGIKVILRGESYLKDLEANGLKNWAKGKIRRMVFKGVDGFLAIGTRNREFYLHHGTSEKKIFSMPYAVDNDFFQRRLGEERPFREKFRKELGLIPGRPVILYASKFLKRKKPGDLLDAYRRLSPDGLREPDPYLLFIGDGEERSELESQVCRLGWSSVKFLGFKNQTKLPRYFDLCDIFVLPSKQEPWGMVVNEAMNAGKAIIVSDQVGAGNDLVENGKNGFVFPAGDSVTLAARLKQLVMDREMTRRFGNQSRKKISSWNFQADVEGLLQCLDWVRHREPL